MSNESSAPVHHVYDGIVEHDNRLPNWWLGILWGTILFAFGYWLYFGVFAIGPNQLEEYQAELHAIASARPAAPLTPLDDATLLALVSDADTVKKGAEAYATTCAACHGGKGEGGIAPNLTDNFWLHGGKPLQIHTTISKGVVEKGMPSWESSLGAERVKNLTAFLLTMKGTNVAGGKAPQGEEEK